MKSNETLKVHTSSYEYWCYMENKDTLLCRFNLCRSEPTRQSFVFSNGWVYILFKIPLGQWIHLRSEQQKVQLKSGNWAVFLPSGRTIECLFSSGSFVVETLTVNIPPPDAYREQIQIFYCDGPTLPLTESEGLDLLASQRSPILWQSSIGASAKLNIGNHLLKTNFLEDISISDLAKDLGISREFFSRSYRLHYGLSPKQYLQSLRLNEFMRKIQFDSLSVTDACFEAGFSDLSSLVRLFKRNYDVSPSSYRS